MGNNKEFRFKVNLGGMIEILSDHLYSSPDVYIRELLQNGVDAIVAREKKDSEYIGSEQGRINITLDEEKSLIFEDNGLGLTEEEIHSFLAIIGQSSKKDLETGKILSDFIGRFGIGLLSYFMVANQICVRTRSINSDTAYEWIGTPDGIYTLKEIEKETIGTTIYLEAKEGYEQYFSSEKVQDLILHYGLILPYPILFNDGETKKQINPICLPWQKENTSKSEILQFGEILFGQPFLDCITLSSDHGNIDGVAYILPYPVQPSTKQNHRVYLKNMLLTEKSDNILPSWAVFTKCIINAKDLRPTASREGFYEDETLSLAREDISLCIAEYLKNLPKTNNDIYRRFIDTHSLVIKSMAIEDDELYTLFIDDLEFSTTRGIMTGKELRLSKDILLYANMEEYRQLSQIFVPQGKLLINAGYVYSLELLRKMADFFPVEVAKVELDEVDDMLKDISLLNAEKAVDFINIAKTILAPFDCTVEMKQFIPSNLPAFYYMNDEAKLYQDILKAQDNSANVFASMLSSFASEIKPIAKSVIYFNMQNPIVRKMCEVKDVAQLEEMIIILYVQTLLIGGFPLRNNELGIMNDKLLSLMEKTLY